MQNPVAVSALSAELQEKARLLAEKLQLPFIADLKNSAAYHFILLVTPDYLALQNPHNKKFTPFHIDFLSGPQRYRYQHAGLKKEMLARALGVSPRDNPRIIDATAGLGRDSFMLAVLGFQITMIERSPVLHALLEDALRRAKLDPEFAPAANRLELIHADAILWLPSTQPDVIYLDPMFPKRQKSASVKKEMALLQELLLKDDNEQALFSAAMACGARRVVVKRPRLAGNIAQAVPNFSLRGKSSRFDVYLK